MLGQNRVLLAGDGQPFHDVVEFTNVSRPGMGLQDGECFRGDPFDAATALTPGLVEELGENRLNVFRPFLQGGMRSW